MAIALCPQSCARFTIAFTSDTPSMSLIFVWQWSSTRFTGLVSFRVVVKSGIFLIPVTDPIVSSPSNLSIVVTPFIFKNAPLLISLKISGSCSFLVNIFTIIVSVKSVTANIMIVFSLRISLVSNWMTFPRMVISPISPTTCESSIVSSSKFLP